MAHRATTKRLAGTRGVTALLLLAGCSVFLFAGLVVTERQGQNAAVMVFSDLPEGTEGQVRIESLRGMRVLTLVAGVTDDLPQEFYPVAPYRLYATLKLPEDRYRDIVLSVAKDQTVSVVLDGFHAWDPVKLNVAGQDLYTNIPADWSGKIELETKLRSTNKTSVCIGINGRSETFGFCHDIEKAALS